MADAIWHILLALAPWLFVGALMGGALHALLPPDALRGQLTGRWAVIKAAAIGVPMPLCSCSVIPVGLSLRRQGASAGATVAFLISTPETGIDSIFVSAGFFGWPFAIFKLASAFVIGLTGGLLTDALIGDSPISREVQATCVTGAARGWRGMLVHSLELLRSLWGWLVIGVLASAAIETLLPPQGLDLFNAYGGAAAMAAALLIGMPLYVCALASVPIAAALVNNGFPAGAALVFLIAGPATNLSTMGAVYRTLGRRALACYLATIALGSVACGLLFDWVIPFESTAASGHMHHENPSWLQIGSALLLVALLSWFAWSDAVRWMKARSAKNVAAPSAPAACGSTRVEVGVVGMTCGNCATKLQRTLSREAGVSDVWVTLDPGRAVVHGEISEPRVRELVAEAGFQAE
jgi:uncharacterized membrane protein YraQ (UPF0718 family)/copper chaperone CopZ